MPLITMPFTESDSEAAYNEWGANCGPNALAFALQIPLSEVRGKIPGFEEKRYTSPSMMKAAIDAMDATFMIIPSKSPEKMFSCRHTSLVRIQWDGPWTDPGANPKWAYRQTHWIATYMVEGQACMVFDVNGGARGYMSWQTEIVPLLLKSYPRAYGGWFPTHIWRII